MKPKVALCISGQMRTFEACFPNLTKYIIDPLKTDIFIHTWANNGISTKAKDEEKANFSDEKVTQTVLKKLYHPKIAVIEEYKDSYSEELNGVKVPDILKKEENQHYKGAIPMFYKMYKCNELKRQYEIKNDRRYDLVIRLRPDLMINEEIPSPVLQQWDILWFSDCKVNIAFQVSDKFAISSSTNMDYYCSVWTLLPQYWENPLGDGEWKNYRVGERLMKTHMEQSGIEFKPFSMSCDICRETFQPGTKVAKKPSSRLNMSERLKTFMPIKR